MNAKRPLVSISILMVLLGMTFSQVLAKEITRATLSGPGLPGEIELSDMQDIDVASGPWREFLTTNQPSGLQTASYYVVRLEISADGEKVGTSLLHYYPGNGDRPGYYFYADCQGCTGSYQTWIRVLPKQDLALRRLLVRLGASSALIGGGDSLLIEELAAFFQQNSLLPMALLVLALFVLVLVRKRGRRQTV